MFSLNVYVAVAKNIIAFKQQTNIFTNLFITSTLLKNQARKANVFHTIYTFPTMFHFRIYFNKLFKWIDGWMARNQKLYEPRSICSNIW